MRLTEERHEDMIDFFPSTPLFFFLYYMEHWNEFADLDLRGPVLARWKSFNEHHSASFLKKENKKQRLSRLHSSKSQDKGEAEREREEEEREGEKKREFRAYRKFIFDCLII